MQLRVLTYNVLANAFAKPEYFAPEAQALLGPTARRGRIVERIAAAAADVICLQEVEGELWVALNERLGPSGYAGAFEQRPGGKPDGVAMLWRLPGYRAAARRLDYEELPGGKPVKRLALLVTFTPEAEATAADSPAFTVACTHFAWQAPKTAAEPSMRLHEAEQLIDALRAVGGPIILAGDLNANPSAGEIRALVAAGLAESHVPNLPTGTISGQPAKIDYLMATAHFEATAHAMDMHADVTCLPSADQPSDHLPLTTDFRLKA